MPAQSQHWPVEWLCARPLEPDVLHGGSLLAQGTGVHRDPGTRPGAWIASFQRFSGASKARWRWPSCKLSKGDSDRMTVSFWRLQLFFTLFTLVIGVPMAGSQRRNVWFRPLFTLVHHSRQAITCWLEQVPSQYHPNRSSDSFRPTRHPGHWFTRVRTGIRLRLGSTPAHFCVHGHTFVSADTLLCSPTHFCVRQHTFVPADTFLVAAFKKLVIF